MHLQSMEASSAELAAMAERDTAAAREVASDFALGQRVRELTLRDLASTLQTIDLSRSTLLLRGPQGAVDAAYKSIGRTPQIIDLAR